MPLTPRQLNRATLARQMLLAREPIGVVDAVRRVMAIQAQEPASPYIALWNRVDGFDPTDLDRAFADSTLLKATLMRVTLHAVAADDLPPLHHAMQQTLRAARLNDRRFRATGMPVDAMEGLVELVREFASEARSNAEVDAWLEERLGDRAHPRIWWAVRQYSSFVHAPTGGPWSFGPRPLYRAAPEPTRTGDPIPAIAYLIRRYLEAFGPATAGDIAAFGLLVAPTVRAGLDALGDEIEMLDGPGRGPLYDLRGATVPHEATPAPPRLLPMWDSILIAYKDRSRIIPDDYRRIVIRINGDILPTVLVDGYVAGVWRPLDGAIEAAAFHRLEADEWAALDEEAHVLVAFLAGRNPKVFARAAGWWDRLPKAESRVLGR